MSALLDEQPVISGNKRLHVPISGSGFCKGKQCIQFGNPFGGPLNFRYKAFYPIPNLLEKLVFQLIDLGFCVQDQALHFFELRRDEPFTIGQGLLPDVVLRNQFIIGSGHFQIVAKDLVEAHLQVLDARPLPFRSFQPGNPFLSMADGFFHVIQFLGIAGTNQAPFPKAEARILPDTPLNQLVNRSQGGNIHFQFFQKLVTTVSKVLLDIRQYSCGDSQG